MSRQAKRTVETIALAAILFLYLILAAIGIRWGLPGRHLDDFLFSASKSWEGERIFRLADGTAKFDPNRGADVDADPLRANGGLSPQALNATDADKARILLRYRLFTFQPDEMITLMALAGMRPGQLKLDPKLYQYGGLFIYPAGALIQFCDWLGWIEVRGHVEYYLDRPDEFAKFYVVARAYAAAWGLAGVGLVFAITRRLAERWAALLATLIFTLMPVVVCMAHEGKPHLPGAVLMLLAVWLALKHVDAANGINGRPRPAKYWWGMCVTCGAALGMVLSSWPIFILIPAVAFQEWCKLRGRDSQPTVGPSEKSNRNRQPFFTASLVKTLAGATLGVLVYLGTNPYIVINALGNREVLRSNFGNSLAMYEVARIGEGFWRVVELTVEGATLPVFLFGLVAVLVAIRRLRDGWPLALPAAVFFLQFTLIGAGKPAEYGRFGILPDTALAIAAACGVSGLQRQGRTPLSVAVAAILVLGTAVRGGAYLWNFHLDAGARGSRLELARRIMARYEQPPMGKTLEIAVLREPAPYSCPPIDLDRVRLVLYQSDQQFAERSKRPVCLIEPVDRSDESPYHLRKWLTETPISWANKPFHFECTDGGG
jgi:hypothetical protein